MTALLPRLDRLTRKFWRLAGRPVDLLGAESWLDAPMSEGAAVGDRWLDATARALGGQVVRERQGAGLMGDMARLAGPRFDPSRLDPRIVGFYEHTVNWRMEVWVQWSPLFQPGGELVARLFGRRIEQLALPMRPLDVAHGMESRVVPIVDAAGVQQAAGWIRTLRSTGEVVFSGCYGIRSLPGSDQPSVHVTFPLEAGNVQVFLEPRLLPGGGLQLISTAGEFGANGAYVVARDGGVISAARVPVHETFTLSVDDEGVLRTDHVLSLWSARAVQLHYKLLPIG